MHDIWAQKWVRTIEATPTWSMTWSPSRRIIVRAGSCCPRLPCCRPWLRSLLFPATNQPCKQWRWAGGSRCLVGGDVPDSVGRWCGGGGRCCCGSRRCGRPQRRSLRRRRHRRKRQRRRRRRRCESRLRRWRRRMQRKGYLLFCTQDPATSGFVSGWILSAGSKDLQANETSCNLLIRRPSWFNMSITSFIHTRISESDGATSRWDISRMFTGMFWALHARLSRHRQAGASPTWNIGLYSKRCKPSSRLNPTLRLFHQQFETNRVLSTSIAAVICLQQSPCSALSGPLTVANQEYFLMAQS